jgi:hypothetical protein
LYSHENPQSTPNFTVAKSPRPLKLPEIPHVFPSDQIVAQLHGFIIEAALDVLNKSMTRPNSQHIDFIGYYVLGESVNVIT